jgi:hypothetical protein
LNSVGVNPDFIYAYSHIDGTGTYRLSGERGDGIFLLFDAHLPPSTSVVTPAMRQESLRKRRRGAQLRRRW